MKVAVAAVTGTRGGPRTYALALLRALAALDGPEEYVLLADQAVDPSESGGVRRLHVPMPGTAARPLMEALALPFLMRRAGADVYHGTKQSVPRGIPGGRLVSIHDLAPRLFPETFSAGAGFYLRRATGAAVKRAHRILTGSHTTARDLMEHLAVPEDKIDVVPYGVDDRFREPVSKERLDAVRARHGLPAEYLLCVGTIQPRKNVDILLDALEILQRAGRDLPPLVLAGRAAWMADEVVRRAQASPLVIHRGEVPNDDLPALYAGAMLFASPSSYEGFGLTWAEAMAAGTAVVAGRGSACDEVVGDAGILVEPRDATGLADALDHLLRDDAERRRLAEAGRERCRRFTWEATALGTRECYRRVFAEVA